MSSEDSSQWAGGNPLKATILEVLRNQPSTRLNELMEVCRPTLSDLVSGDEELRLYEINFLLMNALFELQADLIQDHVFLKVDSMDLRLLPASTAEGHAVAPAGQSELAAYYLDWRNLEHVTAAEVDALLDSFWQRYLDTDKRSWALSRLGLDDEATRSEAQKAYRRLAFDTHPDRGGDSGHFLEVREAWEILSRSLPDSPI